jgi:hypothetical protein
MTGILERHGNRIPLNRDAQQRRDRPQASLSYCGAPSAALRPTIRAGDLPSAHPPVPGANQE